MLPVSRCQRGPLSSWPCQNLQQSLVHYPLQPKHVTISARQRRRPGRATNLVNTSALQPPGFHPEMTQAPRFSSAVLLGDLSDFIAPSQACVNPLFATDVNAAATAEVSEGERKGRAKISLDSDIFSGLP